jgi:hypothetical protein
MATILLNYALYRDGQSLPLDLSDYVDVISARVKFRGSQVVSGSTTTYSTATNSGTGTSLMSANLPPVPDGYTFVDHYAGGSATFTNNTGSPVAIGVYLDTPFGSATDSLMLQPGQTRTLSVSRTRSSSYVGQQVQLVITGYSICTNRSLTARTRGSNTVNTYVQTNSPRVTVNGQSASHSGTLSNNVETDWIPLSGLTPLEQNNLAVSVGGSNQVYITVEVTATPKLAAPVLHTDTRTSERKPYLEMTLTPEPDNPATKYHARARISEYSVMSPIIHTIESTDGGWEYLSGEDWLPMPVDGVDPGTRVRVQTPELGYKIYYWDAASNDGIAYGYNSASRQLRILVTVNNLFSLVHNNEEISRIYSLTVAEASNGEIGEVTFQTRNRNAEANLRFAYGDTILVGINDTLGNTEEFRAMVRRKSPVGPELLEVTALTGDGIFGERIITQDYTSQDIGLTVKSIIDTYCQPLTSINVNIATGFVAPVIAKDKTVISVLEQLRSDFGVHYHVDKDWDMHLYLPSQITSGQVTIQRGDV